MAMDDAAWARPEELKKAEAEAVKRARDGDFGSQDDYSAYYAYKTGVNRELIRNHAVSDEAQAATYVTNVDALLRRLGVAFSGNVIDLGCAIGIIPEHIRRLGTASEVTGVDISETAIEVARRDYPECRFVCQTANDLGNFPPGYASLIHGREFYPFTRTNDVDFQVDCLTGYLNQLKAGGAVVLTMVCLSKGLCTNWPEARRRLLRAGYSVAEKKVLIHPAVFRRLGRMCYKQPFHAILAGLQGMVARVLCRKTMYAYVIIK